MDIEWFLFSLEIGFYNLTGNCHKLSVKDYCILNVYIQRYYFTTLIKSIDLCFMWCILTIRQEIYAKFSYNLVNEVGEKSNYKIKILVKSS